MRGGGEQQPDMVASPVIGVDRRGFRYVGKIEARFYAEADRVVFALAFFVLNTILTRLTEEGKGDKPNTNKDPADVV